MNTLRSREIFRTPSLTLLAVESVTFQHDRSAGYFQLRGTVVPLAVIVCDSEGTRTLDLEGNPFPMGPLNRNAAEFADFVQPQRSS